MHADEFECVIHNLPGAVFRCLPDSSWTLCFVSEGIKDLTGYPASDFLYNARRSLQDIVHPDDWDGVRDRILARITAQKNFSEEVRLVDSQGGERWVYVKGQPVCDLDGGVLFVDAALIDITARKLAEAELLQQKANIQSAMANIPGIVYRTALGKTWTIEFVSDGVEDLFGVPAQKLVGKSLEVYGQFVHPDDLERVAAKIIEAGAKVQGYEVHYRVKTRDGGYRNVYEKGQARERAADGRRFLDGVILDLSRVCS